jgi:hypothetical protein
MAIEVFKNWLFPYLDAAIRAMPWFGHVPIAGRAAT